MAIYIPFRGRVIAVTTANEPAPHEACPGQCTLCVEQGFDACPRDTALPRRRSPTPDAPGRCRRSVWEVILVVQ